MLACLCDPHLIGVALLGLSSGALAQERGQHQDHGQHHPLEEPLAQEPAAPEASKAPEAIKAPASRAPPEHSQHGSAPAMTAEPHAGGEHMGHQTGALGRYPMTRKSSGTAWQPDTSQHMRVMGQSGDWSLMGHGVLNLVYDHQTNRRGDDKVFVGGMLMGLARRPLRDGTLQFRAALSPDPLMGKRGYPLLLASGETADGVDHLIDRQHPHDFFMELSASASQNIGPRSSVFLARCRWALFATLGSPITLHLVLAVWSRSISCPRACGTNMAAAIRSARWAFSASRSNRRNDSIRVTRG